MTTEASLDIFWRGESWRIRKTNGVFTDPEDFLPRHVRFFDSWSDKEWCTPFAAPLADYTAPEVEDERSGIAGGTVCGKLQLDCETKKPGNMEIARLDDFFLLQGLVLEKIAVAVATDTSRLFR